MSQLLSILEWSSVAMFWMDRPVDISPDRGALGLLNFLFITLDMSLYF